MSDTQPARLAAEATKGTPSDLVFPRYLYYPPGSGKSVLGKSKDRLQDPVLSG